MAQIAHAASAEATKLNVNAAENDLTSLLHIAQNSFRAPIILPKVEVSSRQFNVFEAS
jgi:hypothetical protein